MSVNKQCKQCNNQFEVGDWDLDFIKRISPTFSGELFDIPTPSLCPSCRLQRRLVWRNYRILYKRKCDLCRKDIISVFSPDKPHTVYCQECWWSDNWDPLSFGIDFDDSKTFFAQYKELLEKAPRIALMNKNPENSEYCSFAGNNKNSYLLVGGCWDNEDSLYGSRIDKLRECVDNQMLAHSELCYEVSIGSNLFKCFYCNYIYDSSECYFSINLQGCDHCVFSSNLRNKSYYAYNKPCTKEEFEEIVSKISSHKSLQNLKSEYRDLLEKTFHPPVIQKNCEDCEGSSLRNCKNVRDTYDAIEVENAKYFLIGRNDRDIMDCTFVGIDQSQLIYEAISTGIAAYHCMFTQGNWSTEETYYCDTMMGSKNCFGCTSLKKQEYCILNKQYTKDDYEKKVVQIIKHMQESGEWGEFFPMSVCPFGYNESAANEYFPIDKETAIKIGSKWQDDDFAYDFGGEFYQPKDDINDYYENDEEVKKILSYAIKCEKTGKPFKIMPNEMNFYLKNKLAVPRLHPNVRFEDRFKLLSPPQLWDRECMCQQSGHDHDGKCSNKFKSTFSPDRKENVYCQDCYERSLI